MGYKILIVEDDEYCLETLKNILQDENYRVYIHSEGSGAVEKAKEIKADAVMLDIMMPGIDGFSVCQLLKERSGNQEYPYNHGYSKNRRRGTEKGL